MMLRAFAGAQSAVDNLRLIIVGDGIERDNLLDWCMRSGINEKVRFIGKVQYSKVVDYLRLADAFITASVSEVHPLSIIEGMAVGLPVIGIQSPGVGDIIQNGVNGMLSSNDIAAFTACIVRIMIDDSLRKRMKTGAKEKSKDYDIQQTTAQLMLHYQKIIRNKSEIPKLRTATTR